MCNDTVSMMCEGLKEGLRCRNADHRDKADLVPRLGAVLPRTEFKKDLH